MSFNNKIDSETTALCGDDDDKELELEMPPLDAMKEFQTPTPRLYVWHSSRCQIIVSLLVFTGGLIYLKPNNHRNKETIPFPGTISVTDAPTTPPKVYPGYYRKPKNKNVTVTTLAPTLDLTALPQTESDCIESRERLVAAVDAYLSHYKETAAFSVSNWCIQGQKIQDFSRLFDYNRNPLSETFNEPLNNWNMTGATSLTQMFQGAKTFNQPLDQWDISQVVSLRGTFFGADDFNQPLTTWDTSSCWNFGSTFRSADSFNQDLSSWDISKAKDISHVLEGADGFRQDLCGWGGQLHTRTNLKDLKVNEAFSGTSCPSHGDPIIHLGEATVEDPRPLATLDPRGPFCFPCKGNGEGRGILN